jgi:hypothetical protein
MDIGKEYYFVIIGGKTIKYIRNILKKKVKKILLEMKKK